tara:strand:- start:2169 stop:2372 length:204 start_codon:yes stop_codon:yes gene_type:complete
MCKGIKTGRYPPALYLGTKDNHSFGAVTHGNKTRLLMQNHPWSISDVVQQYLPTNPAYAVMGGYGAR